MSRATTFQQIRVAFRASAAAVGIYAVGLLSPLTPSAGVPSTAELLVFVGIPVTVLVSCIVSVRALPLRVILATEALAIMAVSSWLLRLELHTP